jgi:hypothetical protein
MLLTWELVTKGGAWYNITDELAELLKENGLSLEEKFQGEHALFAAIEADPKLVAFLHKYFVEMIATKKNEV